MTNIPNEPNGPSDIHDSAEPQHEAHQTETPKDTPNPNRRIVDAVRAAFKNGAQDARTAASRAIPGARSLAAQAAYGVAYGIAFGAVFTYSLAEGMTPDCVKTGWKDGVKEGRESAEQTAETLRTEPPPVPFNAEPGTAS